MKKILGMLGAALILTVAASASPITTECTTGGNVGGASGANGSNTLSATFTCVGFTAPGGGMVTLAQLTMITSYTGPNNPASFTYTWSGAPNFPNEVINASSVGVDNQPTIFSGAPVNATSSTTVINATSGLGGATFNLGGFNESVTVSGGTLSQNGSLFTRLYVTYDYTTEVPEPATLSIMGTGLIGLGILLRKRRKA